MAATRQTVLCARSRYCFPAATVSSHVEPPRKHAHVPMHTCTHALTLTHPHLHLPTHAPVHTYAHAHARMHAHVRAGTRAHKHVRVHAQILARTHTTKYSRALGTRLQTAAVRLSTSSSLPLSTATPMLSAAIQHEPDAPCARFVWRAAQICIMRAHSCVQAAFVYVCMCVQICVPAGGQVCGRTSGQARRQMGGLCV